MTGCVCVCARVCIVRVLFLSPALLAIEPHTSLFLNLICISLIKKGKCKKVNISGIFSVFF